MRSQTLARWMLSIVLAMIMLGAWLLALNQAPISQSHALSTDYTVGGVCGATIQACINNPIVQAGDRILIPAGTYTESLTLDKPVSLIGADVETAIIHAVANQRVMTVTGNTITATTVISGLTFTGGRAIGGTFSEGLGGGLWLANESAPLLHTVKVVDNSTNNIGGGIFAAQSFTLVDAQILSNSALSGGGVYVQGAINLLGGRFEGNRIEGLFPGEGSGGGLYASAAVLLEGTVFIDNLANEPGGGIYANGMVTVTRALFANNQSSGMGGGIYAGFLSVADTKFISNTAVACGGASANSAVVSNSRFENNRSTGGNHSGGALCVGPNMEAILFLTDTDFISNTSAYYAGAVYATRATIDGGRFEGNSAAIGGAIVIGGSGPMMATNTEFINNTASTGSGGISAGTATLVNARFVHNQASNGAGGGIGAFGAVTAINSEFISNTASTRGGGVYAGGTLTLVGGKFAGNQTDNGSYGGGGGAHAVGMLLITGTQFLDNMTADDGGALSISGGGRIVNALFARNRAVNTGAALYVASYSEDLTILHSTIADTSQNPRQSIFVYLGNVGITDTIIASHTIGIDNFNLSGSNASYQDYNLFFGNTQNLSGTLPGGSHNHTGNPLFVNPLNTDYHLQPGSAAIDQGIFAGVTTDLDGHSRLLDYGGLRVDIGAYEAEFQGEIHNVYLPVTLKSH